ncbi:photosystem II core complex proteins psbY, chloroplastic-like [Cucurbita pepo subsp. pepo]|uniref:photosystem II core complex proteins psbY, chloroplastic-like n=1 Tax=Cucurbita pepo subsp. pepo TaxID=3664 RepID=UPI000C9D9E10|nr:photosystem II core complex proteins psbY, chloroplastic-like [Cucurbita pepo subsp. pepo]
MAATMATMAILNAKCFTPNRTPPPLLPSKPTTPLSLPVPSPKSSLAGSAIAGAIFSTLSFTDAAFAAQQIADLAEGDNRGLALLLPLIPAVAWVLFNILQPALNQINRMRTEKAVIAGLGLGGLLASGLVGTPEAMAAEASNDARGQLLLIVVAPAILWVLYNILQPALNQLNRMRSE